MKSNITLKQRGAGAKNGLLQSLVGRKTVQGQVQHKAEKLGLTMREEAARPSVLRLGPSVALCEQFSLHADLFLAGQPSLHDHEGGKAEGRNKLLQVNSGRVLGPSNMAVWPLVAWPS